MATDYNQHPTPGADELLRSPFVDQNGRLTSPFSPYTPLCNKFDVTQHGNNHNMDDSQYNDIDGTQPGNEVDSDSSMDSSDRDSNAEKPEDEENMSDKENLSTVGTVNDEERLGEHGLTRLAALGLIRSVNSELQSDSQTMATLLELSEAMRYLTRNHVARDQKVLVRLTYGEVAVRYQALGTQNSREPQPSSADTMAYIVRLAKCARYLSREQLSGNEKIVIEYNNDFLSIVYDGTSRRERERVWMSEFIQGPPVKGGGLARTQLCEKSSPSSHAFWIRVEREMEGRGWDSGVMSVDIERGEPYRGRAFTNDEVAAGRNLLEIGI
ncbi:hypothetical protein V5O48_005836 [Marasmius crinis-equi]|uniref:Uncharacterized protein n=1 Tax=Marasmius crinis-equi TaxID=585013 RepID=A0ABR3FL67_9AGAR